MSFLRFLRVLCAPLLVSALATGCALGPPTFEQDVRASVSRGNVFINVRGDGTVVLSGWTEDYYSRQRAESVARRGEGVTRVVNLIQVPF